MTFFTSHVDDLFDALHLLDTRILDELPALVTWSSGGGVATVH